jgi:hypothetical protein
MKHLKHTFKTTETLKNICLQHAYIVVATYVTSQIDFCNIQMKCLKHKSKMPEILETRRHRRPWPPSGELWWGWGAASASARRSAGLQADFVELHLLPRRRSPVRPLRRPVAPPLRHPLCHARQARLLLHRRPTRATLLRRRWTGRLARCSAWWLPRHTCQELDALAELEQLAPAPEPVALRQGVAVPSVRSHG